MELHCTKDERGCTVGQRTLYIYDELNTHGEKLVVELSRGVIGNYPQRRKRFAKGATHFIHCTVEYYDADGIGWGGQRKDYNPMIRKATQEEIDAHVTGCGYVTEFAWEFEDTPENRERMLQEVERRFYGSAKTVRHERAA